jgi:hypothetical protein
MRVVVYRSVAEGRGMGLERYTEGGWAEQGVEVERAVVEKGGLGCVCGWYGTGWEGGGTGAVGVKQMRLAFRGHLR